MKVEVKVEVEEKGDLVFRRWQAPPNLQTSISAFLTLVGGLKMAYCGKVNNYGRWNIEKMITAN